MIELWEWAAINCSDSEMKARIRGVDVHMKTFDFIFDVCLGELILSHSDNLSKTLQIYLLFKDKIVRE